MLKVLYLLNFAGKAGTERYVESLVRYLHGTKIQAYFAYNVKGLLVDRMEAMGIPTYQLTMNSPYDFKAAKKLAALCQTLDIDVVHTHYLRENYIALLAKRHNKKIRVVYTNHFVIGNNAITRLSNRLMAPRQDAMIAVCNKGREQLIRNGNDGRKIQVIFNGVDPAVWCNARASSTLREELGISSDLFVMLCAARFAHDKGHHFLLDSLKLLVNRTEKPFLMVLAGDGDLLEESKAYCHQLGLDPVVRFIGFRQDMKNLYGGSDLYVNASQHEALSFLIIEAMASGLPVIATDMGGNRDIVNPEAHCGELVTYDDPKSMAAAMEKIMGDPVLLAEYQAGALKTVKEKFNIRKIAQDTFDVYARITK